MITLFVGDQQRSKEFYERVFDVAAANEDEGSVIFKFDNLFLRLLTRARAETELLGQVALAESDSGASFQLAIFVEDAEPTSPRTESRAILPARRVCSVAHSRVTAECADLLRTAAGDGDLRRPLQGYLP